MTQRAMKIKVDVQTLISRIEKAKDGAVRQYEKDLVKYETQRATWMKRSAEALTTALAALNKGDDSGVISDNKYLDGRYRPVVSVLVARGEGPIKPRKPDTGKHDRDLALLRMTSDETILISTDDAFASYLQKMDDPFGSVEPIPSDLLTAMEYCKTIFDASRISGFSENQALNLVAYIMTALVPR